MPTPSDIKTHLLADPNKIGYAAHIVVAEGGTATHTMDGDIEALGNAPNASLKAWIQMPVSTLLKCAAGSIYQAIFDFGNNTANNSTMRGLSLAALRLFDIGEPLDFSDPNINSAVSPFGMLQTLAGQNTLGVNGAAIPGPLTTSQLNLLLGAGTKTPCSDFEATWGVGTYINHQQIAQALGRGNG